MAENTDPKGMALAVAPDACPWTLVPSSLPRKKGESLLDIAILG